MQASEKIKAYTEALCDQIRWKKSHVVITEEIENHLADQRNAYMAAGESEEEATAHAIEQMGDPVTIGIQLDRTHRPKPQWHLLLLTAALLMIGFFIRLVVIRSDWERELPVQLLFAAAGLAAMAAAYYMDFTLIGRFPKTFFFIVAAASVTVIYTSPMAHGVRYYGEFMTLLFPLAFAAFIYSFRNKGYFGLVACGLAYLLLCFVALLVPTVAGLMLFAVCGAALLLVAVLKNWFNRINRPVSCLLALAPVTATVTYLLLLPGIRMRFSAMLNPTLHADDYGYICLALREMLSKSRLIGHGAPLSPESSPMLGALDTDTVRVLTHLIYNLGWIASLFVMGVLLFFIIRVFRLCARQKSMLGQLVSASVILTFAAQVIGYALNNLGFPLTDPLSLPLISYGNLAMVLNLMLIGVMLSVFRTGDAARDNKADITHRLRRVSWGNGRLIITYGRKIL